MRARALRLSVALAAGVALTTTPVLHRPEAGSSLVATTARAAPGQLGTNLGGITYYDGIVPFADLMRQAGDWVPQRVGGPWGSGPPLSLRPDGWPARLTPGQLASAVLADNRYPAGRYRVRWSGSGRFDINGTSFRGTNGSGYVRLDGHSMAVLTIHTTTARAPLHAIRVLVPGEKPGAVFRAAYLRALRPYSAVRFMDWQRTNSPAWEARGALHCRTRVTASYYSQGSSRGASVEVMVQLANVLRVRPWFTIPHEAATDWISCHARVVARSLNRALVPRYEFSNETWNPAFRAFGDITRQARARGLGAGDDYLGLQRRTGQLHAWAMGLVAKQMRASKRSFTRVLSGQAANSWVLQQRLLTPGARAATDEIAVAPYLGMPGATPFDPDQAQAIAGLGTADVLAALRTAQVTEVDRWVVDHVALARGFRVRLVAYEGGQHLAGDPGNEALTSLFTSVNRDARLAAIYRTYLARWRAATGNALLMHFTDAGPYTKYGSWGALEYPDQAATGSPKYSELRRFAGR